MGTKSKKQKSKVCSELLFNKKQKVGLKGLVLLKVKNEVHC